MPVVPLESATRSDDLARAPFVRLFLLYIISWLTLPSLATAQDIGQLGPDDLESRMTEVFQRSCALAGCHAAPFPQQDLILTREAFYASAVNEPSQQRPDLMRIHPGNPDSSYLVMKIKGTPDIVGTPMPFVGDRLSEEDVQVIEQWILQHTEVDEARKRGPVAAEAFPFDGWRVINLPTTRALDARSWLFLIGHRFNPQITDGYDAFFGLDGSGIILLSMGYAVTDQFLVSLARSNAAADVELQLRYRLAQQGLQDRSPVGLGLIGTMNWISERPVAGSRFRGEAFKFTGQLSMTRTWGDRIGVGVVPSILVNPNEHAVGEPPLIAIGLGGRWRFYRNLSLVTEWVPVVSGFSRGLIFGNDIRFDSWGSGLEITVGGHVFQITVSNSIGLATDQYLRGGDLDVPAGELRLGFNIFRILNF